MAGTTEHAAVDNFLTPLRGVLKCVTNGVLNGEVPRPHTDGPYVVSLNGGTPAQLGNSSYSLQLGMKYAVVPADGDLGPWKVSTLEYTYLLINSKTKIIGWHWHPLQTPDRMHPHLHSYAAAHSKLHIPTGRVAIEHIAQFAISDLGVRPIHTKAHRIIGEALDNFEKFRTWP